MSIFLSYVRDDERVMKELRRALTETKVASWSERGTASSATRVADDARLALRTASALVVLLSPHALDSPWVQFDVGAALGLGKPVITLVLGDSEKFAVPDWLADAIVIDARRLPLNEVARALSRALVDQGVS